LILVYNTKLFAALWNKLSPEPVVLRYHLQNALFKFNLGYYFKPKSIFPLNLVVASTFSITSFDPKCYLRLLNPAYFFSNDKLWRSMTMLNKTPLTILGLFLMSACGLLTEVSFSPFMELNPSEYKGYILLLINLDN